MELSDRDRSILLTPAVQRLMALAVEGGGEIRVVGGAVRDVVRGKAPTDRDLATTLVPEKLMQVLQRTGVKVVPTGLAHGTVTAVIDGVGYEITTLRQDVATDGRHAAVAFTHDWAADAARRDFTMNALYVDAAGQLYDFTGGVADAKAGNVRFIGDAGERIAEDVLRILRFYRFYAAVGHDTMPDPSAIEACAAQAYKIPLLSRERVWKEFSALLRTARPARSLELMRDAGILSILLPDEQGRSSWCAGGITAVAEQQGAGGYSPAQLALWRFSLLLHPGAVSTAARLFKMAKREADYLHNLHNALTALQGDCDLYQALWAVLYRYGPDLGKDALLSRTFTHRVVNDTRLWALVTQWVTPSFPLRAADVLAIGVAAGPDMGHVLRTVEHWWVHECGAPDHAECMAMAKKVARGYTG